MEWKFVTMATNISGQWRTIDFERVVSIDESRVFYTAQKDFDGIIIYKATNNPCNAVASTSNQDMQIDYRCFNRHKITEELFVELRRIRFWFFQNTDRDDVTRVCRNIVRELNDCAYNYTDLFKAVLQQMKSTEHRFLQRITLDIAPMSSDQQNIFLAETPDQRTTDEVIRDTLKMRLEEAFPNLLSMDDLIRILDVKNTPAMQAQLQRLESDDIICRVPLGGDRVNEFGYRRKIQLVNQKTMVNMESVSRESKPTIAIVTNLLCEQEAVNALIENKSTYVKYKTTGDSNVYTIGQIGEHCVISIKISMVGHERKAKILGSGAITRLFGAFQTIKHVFLVGVSGGIPHVSDFEKHSRLGDIVVAAPALFISRSSDKEAQQNDNGTLGDSGGKITMSRHSTLKLGENMLGFGTTHPFYFYCDQLIDQIDESTGRSRKVPSLKSFGSPDPTLAKCVDRVLDKFETTASLSSSSTKESSGDADDNHLSEWSRVLKNAQSLVGIEYERPPPETDKLKQHLGDGLIVDITHPALPQGAHRGRLYPSGHPVVRMGHIGSGQAVVTKPLLRDRFADEHQLLAYDSEYDQILESILGNGVESFLIIRGIADYVDGRQDSPWQYYSALSAASLMKTVLLNLDTDEY